MDATDPRGLSQPDLVEAVEERSAHEIRSLRDDCRELESEVSYRRRVVQGRLDIARAERDRRREGGSGALVDDLPSILADQPTGRPSQQRAVAVEPPGDGDASDVPAIADLPDLDDAGLEGRIEALEALERQLSAMRRGLLANLDRLQAEMVARYRDGRADIADVISGGDADRPADDEPSDG